jgi:hypothetical protein
MTSLFPPRESLVSDIPAGDGNIEKLFYGALTSNVQRHVVLKSYKINGTVFAVCLSGMPCGRPSPSSHLTVPSNRFFSSSDLPSKGSSKQPKSLLSRPPPPPTQSSANRGFAGRGATTPEPPTTPSSGPGATVRKQEENILSCSEKGLFLKPYMRKCAKVQFGRFGVIFFTDF